MHGSDPLTEQIVQSLAVELLRDLIDNPPPEQMVEGSQEFNTWMLHGLTRAERGINFYLTVEQETQIMNLAFNYWLYGPRQAQAMVPKKRIIQVSRHWPEAQEKH
jgi:hypothetical protein